MVERVLKKVEVGGKIFTDILDIAATNFGITNQQFEELYAEQQNAELFESEKSIALQIMNDYQLGLYSITDQDITDTRLYIQSIEPLAVASNQRSAMPRPEIFSRYKRNPYEL